MPHAIGSNIAGILEVKTKNVKDFLGKGVPITKAWRVLRLRMEEQPPIWRVAANMLNKY